MICLRCDCEEFSEKEMEIEQYCNDELLMVLTHVMTCNECGWQCLGNGQLDELRKRTADVYRKKHGLLTSQQIIEVRTKWQMTQKEFADFLGVDETTVKRWETWRVQTSDENSMIMNAGWLFIQRNKVSDNFQNCPDCPNQGWYARETPNGEPEQIQCQWCHVTPDSKFNYKKMGIN